MPPSPPPKRWNGNEMIRLALTFAVLALGQPETRTFYGAGVAGFATSSPKPSGWAVAATEMSARASVWSFSEYDVTRVQGARPIAFQSSVRTGLATPLRNVGPATMYGLIDAGVANSSTTVGGAISTGGVAVLPIGKTLVLLFGGRVLKTAIGGSQTIWNIGFGWRQ